MDVPSRSDGSGFTWNFWGLFKEEAKKSGRRGNFCWGGGGAQDRVWSHMMASHGSSHLPRLHELADGGGHVRGVDDVLTGNQRCFGQHGLFRYLREPDVA